MINTRKEFFKNNNNRTINQDYVMGIDLSTSSTGIAVINKNEEIIYIDNLEKVGTIKKNNIMDFYIAINTILNKFNPSIIIVEDVYYSKNFKAISSLIKYHGMLELILISKNLNYKYVQTNVCKAFFKCKHKEDVFKLLNDRYKLNFDFEKDNDKTDALMLALNFKNEKVINND